MVEGYYTLVVKELKAIGYSYSGNTKGSHERWACAGRPDVIVPRNLMSRHTANAILRTAGLAKKF